MHTILRGESIYIIIVSVLFLCVVVVFWGVGDCLNLLVLFCFVYVWVCVRGCFCCCWVFFFFFFLGGGGLVIYKHRLLVSLFALEQC